MRNYILDSDHLSKKTTDAYSMLYYMIPFLNNIEKTSKDAFEEINDHNELGNEDYTSIKGNMEHIQEYMNKYKAFGAVTNGAGQKSSSGYNYDMGTTYQSSTVGYSNNDGFIGEYQREVDDIFYYAQVNTIQKLRDSKLQDIRVNNNVGIKGEVPSSLLTMQTKMSNGIDKDKIGLEDLLGFGRISEAMHKEYEDIKAEVDAYNASLPQYSSKNSSKFLPDFISKFIFDAEIDRVKIDSYDEYINKIVTQSDFDYETEGERMLSIGGYFVPLFGQYKMLAEIVDGKDLVSGRRYSVGEQLFAISTMGAGSVIGKAYKGVKAGLASGVEETSSKVEGTVLAMNGARDSNGIEKLAKSITEKIAGKGVSNPKINIINDADSWIAKLTTDEQKTLYRYQSNDIYERLNSGLRNSSLDEDLVDSVKNLDSAIEKGVISDETQLYRGFTKEDVIEHWDEIVKGNEYTFEDGAYISTSTKPSTAEMFAMLNEDDGIFAYIKVKNVDGANIGAMKMSTVDESEILLERGLTCTITKAWEEDGMKYVEIEVSK